MRDLITSSRSSAVNTSNKVLRRVPGSPFSSFETFDPELEEFISETLRRKQILSEGT